MGGMVAPGSILKRSLVLIQRAWRVSERWSRVRGRANILAIGKPSKSAALHASSSVWSNPLRLFAAAEAGTKDTALGFQWGGHVRAISRAMQSDSRRSPWSL